MNEKKKKNTLKKIFLCITLFVAFMISSLNRKSNSHKKDNCYFLRITIPFIGQTMRIGV